MLKRSNFLKKLPKKHTTRAVSLPPPSAHSSQSFTMTQPRTDTLSREQLNNFTYICTFDKKVWVTFSNDLQLCALFDLHAVHQRIRYQFYLAKFKDLQGLGSQCSIQTSVIEKAGKQLTPVYGPVIRTIIRVNIGTQALFEGKNYLAEVYGITLQRNNQGDVCIVAYRPIFNRKLLPQQLLSIIQDRLTCSDRVPTVIDEWIGEFACKNAYKFNHQLPPELPQKLISNLARCEFPWHCVHGRTTVHVKPLQFPKKGQ